jgi:guanylate kinase
MILQDTLLRRGMMLVLSSPSGAGKTTIAKALLEKDKNITLSVSKTTRPPRPNEIEGKDYFFTDKKTFLNDLENDSFLEFAEVFGNYYGTPREPVENFIKHGKDVLFDVDWQGAQQIKQKSPQDYVSIFILPPSLSALEERLKNRASDSLEVILKRLNQAKADMEHFFEYDYVLINDDVERCIQNISLILKVERLKRHRQTDLSFFVQNMK